MTNQMETYLLEISEICDGINVKWLGWFFYAGFILNLLHWILKKSIFRPSDSAIALLWLPADVPRQPVGDGGCHGGGLPSESELGLQQLLLLPHRLQHTWGSHNPGIHTASLEFLSTRHRHIIANRLCRNNSHFTKRYVLTFFVRRILLGTSL